MTATPNNEAAGVFSQMVSMERVAQLMAHRACHSAEHDPANGRIHGYCMVCGVPWPCAYAGELPTPAPSARDADGEVADPRLQKALDFIDGLRDDLHNRRVADWYPEGADNAARQMSEDMRLLGNACADFDIGDPPASVPVAELVALAEKWRREFDPRGLGSGTRVANRLIDELTALAQKGDARGQG